MLGVLFGVCAQRSRFCLRAAVVEFSRGNAGAKTSVWLLTFAAAIVSVQGLIAADILVLDDARMLAVGGSISGALIGGALFGIGMVLARGCSGRLLVLAATGNLRALLSGLVFAVAAQMALRGALSPLREALAGLWTTGGTNVEIVAALGVDRTAGVAFAAVWLVAALVFALCSRVGTRVALSGLGVGACVAGGWLLTYWLSQQTFDPTQVESITFSGPSADTLMFLLTPGFADLDFDVGLVPGVFLGAFLAAWWSGELRLQGFEGATGMRRYLVGAVLMGFGAMLAGGCAIGAGVTGGSAFVLTAWIALTAMWAGGAAADLVVDRGWRPFRGRALAT